MELPVYIRHKRTIVIETTVARYKRLPQRGFFPERDSYLIFLQQRSLLLTWKPCVRYISASIFMKIYNALAMIWMWIQWGYLFSFFWLPRHSDLKYTKTMFSVIVTHMTNKQHKSYNWATGLYTYLTRPVTAVGTKDVFTYGNRRLCAI